MKRLLFILLLSFGAIWTLGAMAEAAIETEEDRHRFRVFLNSSAKDLVGSWDGVVNEHTQDGASQSL